MKKKAMISLLAAGLLAGCTTGSEDKAVTAMTSVEKRKELEEMTDEEFLNSAPSLIRNLIRNCENDVKAQECWENLLNAAAKDKDYCFQTKGTSEIYLYDEDKPSYTYAKNLVNTASTDMVFYSISDYSDMVEITNIMDAQGEVLSTYGLIDDYCGSPVQTGVDFTSTKDNTLSGVIVSLKLGKKGLSTTEGGALEILKDTTMDFGYVRSVTPITDSSYYEYELIKEGRKWLVKVTLDSSKLSDFHKYANKAGHIVENRDNRAELAMDDIDNDTYIFTFDEDGILESVENKVYHVLNPAAPDDEETYVNIKNSMTFKKAYPKDLNTDAFTIYFQNCLDEIYEKGSEFTIEDWK